MGLPAWTPELRARGWIAMETSAGVPLAPPPAHGHWSSSQWLFLPQAGQQPVPGPRDGTAGQRAEWEGLSHSEDQVMWTQKPLSGMPTCCTGTGAPFPSSSLLKRPGMLSGRGAFEACGRDARCLFLPIPESSRGSSASSVRKGKDIVRVRCSLMDLEVCLRTLTF